MAISMSLATLFLSQLKIKLTCVTAMAFPSAHHPACSRYCGSCVVFPLPVCPTTMVVGYVSTRYKRLCLWRAIGSRAAGLYKAGMKEVETSSEAIWGAWLQYRHARHSELFAGNKQLWHIRTAILPSKLQVLFTLDTIRVCPFS